MTVPAPNSDLLACWRERLSNLSDLSLPTDYPRPIPHRVVEAETTLAISDATSLAILKLSLALVSSPASSDALASSSSPTPVSPFSILLAAFAVLLHRHSGEEDITVGSSSNTTNPLVLRFSVKTSDSLLDVVRNVLRSEREAAAIEIPFSDLIDGLHPVPGSRSDDLNVNSRPPLFKVRFFNLTDTTADTLSSTTTSSTCDLTVFISQAPTLRRLLPIEIKVHHNTVLFSHARIQDMLAQIELVLVADPSASVGSISLVTSRSKAILPNPAESLNWSGFEGAITDIFARNARAHPDRVFVVQACEGVGAPPKPYKYGAINAASNILAHHLIRGGIKREDVVVLYSYRGVDLVVAVMGVLKAGATFSVIDIAYPPARQTLYLSVAKPRGLVVLRKAGVLDPDVRKYIHENLDIICEVPALEIRDDGVLVGGSSEAVADVLDADRDKGDVEPGIELGPDSIGTLSFTSGSSGIPKGVRGRHFSLTHFYPWMKQEFGMSENDHFTMLSGIAHDPIQRDLFTPMFLGAELHIPTAEDIGSPGRLAEWMAEHGITITHLTPAMGQLLSANAVHPIPTLRNAFFVGDVLTKRDVLRLQHLAPNTTVINMYGTTETQRAVSYLSIPPTSSSPGFLTGQKDIMPAGRGMRNVQLLVVNPCGLLAGVGEVGEIYVRSGGLAEEYLVDSDSDSPNINAEKFVLNPFAPAPVPNDADRVLPFYRGPRDRMYRSGDLGRYRADGIVECTGRADDQIKIRGFRIELKEIDTHLSLYPNVRENVTLVRRDKDEEKTLVSYFVLLDPEVDVDAVIRDIREHLKQKLPSYAIPSGKYRAFDNSGRARASSIRLGTIHIRILTLSRTPNLQPQV
ncbi:hypothetical protein BDK51DRAFT_25376 [Blyttiomyces helicus]|uniref:AMP-dependent synthetase/ligase domain-containing protein n=1 Tax=Blyttiomyces helicus TaxID=388810 RepID=A0A4P9WL13_9FUNG|nr:hypothetical protein BDK51DRAFT_25376 [Blyttiomyces helicus]|eukprot:RKO93709.1 hypothetical protein BDK51DRAFT_25376 [Blyttiomyces helicus]